MSRDSHDDSGGTIKSTKGWHCGENACWIEGNATAFGIYTKLYQHRDQHVIIDDVDSLYTDKSAVRLLKCLCQTDAEKKVAWNSAAASLQRDNIPTEFRTTSRVCIISNDWNALNTNVEAVQDRGHLIEFAPSLEELHRQVATWFHDQEVFDWMAKHLAYLASPSMRDYVRAAEPKEGGLPWKKTMLSLSLPEKTAVVAELKDDPNFGTEEERVSVFVDSGYGSRATYFNHSRRLRSKGKRKLPEIQLDSLPAAG